MVVETGLLLETGLGFTLEEFTVGVALGVFVGKLVGEVPLDSVPEGEGVSVPDAVWDEGVWVTVTPPDAKADLEGVVVCVGLTVREGEFEGEKPPVLDPVEVPEEVPDAVGVRVEEGVPEGEPLRVGELEKVPRETLGVPEPVMERVGEPDRVRLLVAVGD